MKKFIGVLSLGVIASAAIIFTQIQSGTSLSAENQSVSNELVNANVTNHATIDVETLIKELENSNDKMLSVNTDVNDYSIDFESMKQQAKLIVTGKVVAQEQFNELVVISTVEVTGKHKGKEVREIKIHQLGHINDEAVLGLDQQYILFLGEQLESADENSYYITGGEQGAFQIINGGSLEIHDPIMKEAVGKIKKEKTNAKNEYEAIVNAVLE